MIKLKVKTQQEAFDLVMKRLHKQKVPSITGGDDDVSCVYAGVGRHRCAIGHLLDAPKSKLVKLDNIDSLGIDISGLIENGVVDPGELNDEFLNNLQYCHDSAALKKMFDDENKAEFLEIFDEKMKIFAKEYELNFEN